MRGNKLLRSYDLMFLKYVGFALQMWSNCVNLQHFGIRLEERISRKM